MRRHLRHFLIGALGVVVATLPALVADPYVRHIVEAHPIVATYLPLATGLLVAIYQKLRPSTTPAGT